MALFLGGVPLGSHDSTSPNFQGGPLQLTLTAAALVAKVASKCSARDWTASSLQGGGDGSSSPEDDRKIATRCVCFHISGWSSLDRIYEEKKNRPYGLNFQNIQVLFNTWFFIAIHHFRNRRFLGAVFFCPALLGIFRVASSFQIQRVGYMAWWSKEGRLTICNYNGQK